MDWLLFIVVAVLVGAVLTLLLLGLTYWIDRPRSEEVWQRELDIHRGIARWFIAQLHRNWLKERKKHDKDNGLHSGEGVSPQRDIPPDTAHSGGGRSLPVKGDGNDSPGVFLGDSDSVRGRDLSSDRRISQGGGSAETQGSTPAGEGNLLSGEDRRPRPSGVSDFGRSIQPTGGQRPEHDGDDVEESFAEALERRGRELGI